MTHDIAGLTEKVGLLENEMSELMGAKTTRALLQIMHRQGWTTLREAEFVRASLEALHEQVTSIRMQFSRLIQIADQIGK